MLADDFLGWKDPTYGIYVYPGTGSAKDGLRGDHLIIAPPFTITKQEVEWFVGQLEKLLTDFFAEFDAKSLEK